MLLWWNCYCFLILWHRIYRISTTSLGFLWPLASAVNLIWLLYTICVCWNDTIWFYDTSKRWASVKTTAAKMQQKIFSLIHEILRSIYIIQVILLHILMDPVCNKIKFECLVHFIIYCRLLNAISNELKTKKLQI